MLKKLLKKIDIFNFMDWLAFHDEYAGVRRRILRRVDSAEKCIETPYTYCVQESGDIVMHIKTGVHVMPTSNNFPLRYHYRTGFVVACIRTPNMMGDMRDCLHWFRGMGVVEWMEITSKRYELLEEAERMARMREEISPEIRYRLMRERIGYD